MSHRKLDYLIRRRIVYRRGPITDTPSESYSWGDFYESGTYECYELFRSKAKITSYRSFKWHILVLWYLNSQLTYDDITELTRYIADKENGFITITISNASIKNLVDEVFEMDLDEPPKNKLRKIIFKDNSGLETSQKLSIVGKLIGKKKKAEAEDIYETMLYIHDTNRKITISNIAKALKVSTRTIYRNITTEIKMEKILLNEEI
jgi:transcriptional antiterminator